MSAPTTESVNATSTDRETEGRFAAGSPVGPGNPFARQSAALRQALLDAVTTVDMAAIARALIEKASKGDTAAARLVLSYILGKPGPTVNPDRLDADEWQGYKDTAGMVQEMPAMLRSPDPALPLNAVRSTRPVLTREMARQLGDMLAHPEKYEEEIPDLELVDDDTPPSPNGDTTAAPPAAKREPLPADLWRDRMARMKPSSNGNGSAGGPRSAG